MVSQEPISSSEQQEEHQFSINHQIGESFSTFLKNAHKISPWN
jgi:hypothetical protein